MSLKISAPLIDFILRQFLTTPHFPPHPPLFPPFPLNFPPISPPSSLFSTHFFISPIFPSPCFGCGWRGNLGPSHTALPNGSSGPAAPTTTPTQSTSGTATASSSATYSLTRTLAGTRCAICRAMGSALCKGGLTARYGTQGLRFQNQENSQIGPNQFRFLCCCSCTTASIGYLKPLLEHCRRHA